MNRIDLINSDFLFSELPTYAVVDALAYYFSATAEAPFDPDKIYNVVGEQFEYKTQVWRVLIAQTEPIPEPRCPFINTKDAKDMVVVGNTRLSAIIDGQIEIYARDDFQIRTFPALRIYPSTSKDATTQGVIGFLDGVINLDLMIPLDVVRERITEISRRWYDAVASITREPTWMFGFRELGVPAIQGLGVSLAGDYDKSYPINKIDNYVFRMICNYRVSEIQYQIAMSTQGRWLPDTTPIGEIITDVEPNIILIAGQ